MIAIDTNVLVRFLTNDSPAQGAAAKQLIDSQQLWISKTVVLETEWVIRGVYRMDRNAVDRAFRQLLGLTRLTFEDRPQVLQALSWFRSGMDFADALHLASSASVNGFATFDRGLAKTAATIPEAPEVLRL